METGHLKRLEPDEKYINSEKGIWKITGKTVIISSVPVGSFLTKRFYKKRDLFYKMESTTRVSGADNESRWKIPRSYHISRYSTNRGRTKEVGKVKCLTLHSQGSSEKSKLLLGLKEPKSLGRCEFEPGLLENTPRKTRMKKGPGSPKRYTNVTSPSNSSLMLRESAIKTKASGVEEKTFRSKDLSIERESGLTFKPYELSLSDKDLKEKPTVEAMKNDNSVGLFDSHEQNEENSKAFMESIGSWINDLFSVPHKRNVPQKNEKEVQKELALEDDTEYLKSITSIKEQFRKKLKTETSVHISVPDTPFELNFDKILDNPKRQKKKAKSSLLPSNSDWLDELNDNFTSEVDVLGRQHNHGHTPPMVIRSGVSETDFKPACCTVKPKNSLQLAVLDSSKGKRKVKAKSQQSRLSMKDLEDHVLPKTGDISKKVLLNVNEQEKFSQFYKNSHLGAQDYVQRKGKAYQSNTRCYTTKAKVRGKLSNGSLTANRNNHYSSAAVAPAKSFAEFLAKNPLDYRKNKYRYSSRKAVCELTRDPMSFTKMKTAPFPTILESKSEAKSTSDDLVKHLIKRIKSSRPHLTKTKGRTRVPQVLGNGKNRFMQSATNSLVMTVMAKREENTLTSKSTPRLYLENKQNQAKELILKQSDTVMRMDFAKESAGNKFDKTTYLPEEETEEDYYSDNAARRSVRQSYDDIMKRELSKSEKYHRRQEVKRMLSSLDMNSVFQGPKPLMKKEQSKKLTTGEEFAGESVILEVPNPRFQKQHELFRKGLKAKSEQTEQQELASPVAEERKVEPEAGDGTTTQTELAVIAPEPVVLLSEEPEKIKAAEPEKEPVVEQPVVVACSKTEAKAKEPEVAPKKSPQIKTEKKAERLLHVKEKIPKAKAPTKEIEPKSLMRPLLELCASEAHKDIPKPCEIQIHPKDLIPSKIAEPLLINRRYSTTSVGGTSKTHGAKLMPWNYINPSLYLVESSNGKCKDKDKDKEKEKEYRKERGGEHCYKDPPPKEPPKKEKSSDWCSREPPPKEPPKEKKKSDCGFDKEKEKPGPICGKD